ncbi:hypothetical protein ACQEVG_32765 [Streptomyces sp. CA-135486]|uniref:hypothetical protein n=1 Tax=Streptomyces sp. CA-135486 TaxID=3240049 RepID=UPI003D8D618B
MTALEDILREAERHIDYSNREEVPDEVFDVLRALVGEVQALKERKEAPGLTLSAMTRTDALQLAREHVEAMSTNARGYQDGVKLADKVQAMDAFARFLMGESA